MMTAQWVGRCPFACPLDLGSDGLELIHILPHLFMQLRDSMDG